MSRDATHVQVEIFGQTYRLRADGDPAYVEFLAEFVDRKMTEISNTTKNVDTLKVAVLAALNIADEHLRAQRARAMARARGEKAGPAEKDAPGSASPAAEESGRSAEFDRRSADLLRILDEALAE